jgi:hypothetical protein
MAVLNYAATTAAAAAARAAEVRRQEEEEMTAYGPNDLEQYEFKIIRSATGAFKDPAKLRTVLEEEAKAGWELVEKFDNSRVRLKRALEWRDKDRALMQDPYRTTIGISEGKLALWIVLGVIVGFGLFAAIVAAIANAR